MIGLLETVEKTYVTLSLNRVGLLETVEKTYVTLSLNRDNAPACF
jgi:hypothetical protein